MPTPAEMIPFLQSATSPADYSSIITQQQQLQRNQAMAQALMQGAMQPQQTQVIGGRAIPMGLGNVLGQVGSAYMANRLNQKNDQQVSDITQRQAMLNQQMYANALRRASSALGGQQQDPQGQQPQQTQQPPQQSQYALGGMLPNTDGNVPASGSQVAGDNPNVAGGSPMASTAPGTQPTPPTLTQRSSNLALSGSDPMLSALFPELSKKMIETGMQGLAPTDMERTNAYIGRTPQQQLAIDNAKALKESQLEYNQGKGFHNFLSGDSGFTSETPANSNVSNFDYRTGNVGSVSSISGADDVLTNNAAATAKGTQGQAFGTRKNSDGTESQGRNTDLWPTDGRLPTPAQMAAIQRDAAANGITNPVINWKQPPSSVSTGAQPTSATINTDSAKSYAAIPDNVVKAQQSRTGLQSALAALDNTSTGPGTASAYKLTAMLNNLGLPIGKDATENYQTLSKYLNNALASASAVNGNTGTDSKFDQFMHGQPSSDLMNKGPLRGAINYVLSQLDAVPAGAKFMQDEYKRATQNGSQTPAYDAQTAWSNVYDPRVFQFSRMSPAERQQFKASMSADQREAFGQKYNQFHQNGWVQ